jgi:hypothetical protein
MSTASFVENRPRQSSRIEDWQALERAMLALSKKNKPALLDNVLPENVEIRIDEGVMIGTGRRRAADKAGAITKRTMLW